MERRGWPHRERFIRLDGLVVPMILIKGIFRVMQRHWRRREGPKREKKREETRRVATLPLLLPPLPLRPLLRALQLHLSITHRLGGCHHHHRDLPSRYHLPQPLLKPIPCQNPLHFNPTLAMLRNTNNERHWQRQKRSNVVWKLPPLSATSTTPSSTFTFVFRMLHYWTLFMMQWASPRMTVEHCVKRFRICTSFPASLEAISYPMTKWINCVNSLRFKVMRGAWMRWNPNFRPIQAKRHGWCLRRQGEPLGI